MGLKCDFCGKTPHYGNVISHANNTRRRRWNPNVKRMRAVVAGVKKRVRVCTACIRADRAHALHIRSEEHTSELQSLTNLVCRLLLEKKKQNKHKHHTQKTT